MLDDHRNSKSKWGNSSSISDMCSKILSVALQVEK
ncbi:hypothetical protein GBF38_023012, partial [Nibea albiflora]